MSADASDPYDFANRRHIGPSFEEIAEMLRVVGVSSLDSLIDETVPKDIRLGKALDFNRPLSERGALDRLRETANKNRVLTSLTERSCRRRSSATFWRIRHGTRLRRPISRRSAWGDLRRCSIFRRSSRT